MRLSEYFNSLSINERQDFIVDLSASLNKEKVTIRSYINGNRNIQPEHASTISSATNGEVTLNDLCPNVFIKAA